MKRRGWGRIVSTASAHSLVASPYKSAYVTAKHGLVGLTKTVALELATFNITANCISPGYVWTPLVERQIPDTMKARNLTEEQVINDVCSWRSRRNSSSRSSRLRPWPCFYARTPPRRSPARTYPWTAAGRPPDTRKAPSREERLEC
jgi:3-hydroxybutyrate dehydrogenase